MWSIITGIILLFEVGLITAYFVGKICKRNINKSPAYLSCVVLLAFALYFVPYIHGITVLHKESNYVFDAIDNFKRSIQLFFGGVNTGAVAEFTLYVPLFTVAYLFGSAIALITTISAAVEAFNHKLKNCINLKRALNRKTCDIVLYNSEKSKIYAKTSPCVLLLEDNHSDDAACELMKEGYTVLRRNFTKELLDSNLFNSNSRYNFIISHSDSQLTYLDSFIAHKNSTSKNSNTYLYIELEGNKADTISRELIEKSSGHSFITTFCTNELLARTFTEKNPITRYLPSDFIEDDASILPEAKLNIVFLGFSDLSSQIYRKSLMNDQLVSYVDGEYRLHNVNYFIYSPDAPETVWCIGGLKKTLEGLQHKRDQYFPLPEMPYNTSVIKDNVMDKETLCELSEMLQGPLSHTHIIIDTGDDYANIELSARLRAVLPDNVSCRIFVKTELSFVKENSHINYFGKAEDVFTRDVIINEGLADMSKALNSVYSCGEYNADKAQELWRKLDRFSRNSNIHSALSLRVKLNLLGLDYVLDGKGKGIDLISEKYPAKDQSYAYCDYFKRSKKNALLAEEHARWNAHHLISEYLPMPVSQITEIERTLDKVKFKIKDQNKKLHSCLTTFSGLDLLSKELVRLADNGSSSEDYDYYKYDEMLLQAAPAVLENLGYSVVERKI